MVLFQVPCPFLHVSNHAFLVVVRQAHALETRRLLNFGGSKKIPRHNARPRIAFSDHPTVVVQMFLK